MTHCSAKWWGTFTRNLRQSQPADQHVDPAGAGGNGWHGIEGARGRISEARGSAETHAEMRRRPRRSVDFWTSGTAATLAPARSDENAALDALLNGMFGPPVPVVAGLAEAIARPEPAVEEEASLFGEDRANVFHQGNLSHAAEANRENYYRALHLIERSAPWLPNQRFLHWQGGVSRSMGKLDHRPVAWRL